MKLNRIYSAILLSTLPLTPALAAGLDRSGQSIAAFYNWVIMQKQVFQF